MAERNRRTVLAAGAAALTGGILASVGTTGADERCCAPAPAESNGWTSYRGTAANTAYVETDAFPKLETIAWEYDETGDVVAVDDRVYVRTDDEIHALDAVDGDQRWKTTVAGAEGTPAVADGTVFVAGERLTALDGGDGDVLWAVPVDGSGSTASPTVADGTVYAIADGSLYAVDAGDGSIAWRHDDIYELPSAADEEVDGYEETEEFGTESAILGTDLEDGSKRWAIPHADLEDLDHSDDGFPYAVSEDALYVSADGLVAVRSVGDDADGEGDTGDDADDESRDGESGDETADNEPSTDDRASEADRDSDDETDARLGTDEPETEGVAETESDGATDETDSVPGFTTGAGLVGGGLALEWFRCRATTDEPAE